MLEQVQQVGSLFLVAQTVIDVLAVRVNGPAVFAVVALPPPAIEHTQIEHAVDCGLHARRATGLQWIFRCIDPDIDTGD